MQLADVYFLHMPIQTGVNHTGLQFYNSVEQLYQAADSVCRVVETIQQMSTIAGVERLCLTMQNATRLTLVVGEVVQMKACTWVSGSRHGAKCCKRLKHI